MVRMPISAPRFCSMVGCKALVRNTNRCDAHKAQVRKQVEANRQSAVERGYGWKWSKARTAYLTEHPLCECSECQAGHDAKTAREDGGFGNRRRG